MKWGVLFRTPRVPRVPSLVLGRRFRQRMPCLHSLSRLHHCSIEPLLVLTGASINEVQEIAGCCVGIDGNPMYQIGRGFNDLFGGWGILSRQPELAVRHRARRIKLDTADHTAIGVEL